MYLYFLTLITINLGFFECKKENGNKILYFILCAFSTFFIYFKNPYILVLSPILISQCLIDLKKMELSDYNNFSILLISFLYSFNLQSINWKSFIIVAIFYMILYLLPFSNLGFGDVKLVIPLSLFLNVSYIPSFIFYTLLISLFLGIVYKIIKKQNIFPMGPAIIITFVLCFLKQV